VYGAEDRRVIVGGKILINGLGMRVNGTTPLWIAAKTLLSERGEEFFQLRDRVLKTNGPEEIHDLRVASRRLREGLALFAPCYPVKSLKRLIRGFKRVTRLLGDIRNTDEAIIFFMALGEEVGSEYQIEFERVLGSFWKKRKKEMKALQTGLRELASNQLRDLFRRVVNSPSLFSPPGNDVDLFWPLSQFAGDALATRSDEIFELLPEARENGNVESQHLLRIAIKHYRYRGELLSFLFSEGYEDMHGVLKSYQDILGKMHDLDVFAEIACNSSFLPQTERIILDTIAQKRERLFADFSSMLEVTPLERIAAQLGSAL
jgi:CHAD domain-containing protein